MLSRALLIVVGTHAALVSPTTHAQSFGDWTVGAGQGWITGLRTAREIAS
jgi:hypothetical protein